MRFSGQSTKTGATILASIGWTPYRASFLCRTYRLQEPIAAQPLVFGWIAGPCCHAGRCDGPTDSGVPLRGLVRLEEQNHPEATLRHLLRTGTPLRYPFVVAMVFLDVRLTAFWPQRGRSKARLTRTTAAPHNRSHCHTGSHFGRCWGLAGPKRKRSWQRA